MEQQDTQETEVYNDEDDVSELSSSPSIPDENIDFNFVYALHTFVATVEGQATCTKGDYLTLLDDSNSYWWLVRNLKDQSIGYLPAEHIETPPERLARFNKHRNVDYGAPGLDDMDSAPVAKPKKKLFQSKKAVNRSVAFSQPTVIEYATYYDTEEEQELELLESNGLTDKLRDATDKEAVQKQTDPDLIADDAPTKKISLTPNVARDSVLAGTKRSSTELDESPVRSTHTSAPSQSSIKSDLSNVSDESRESKEKAKKKSTGVFGGLFKRRTSKKEKSLAEPAESHEITEPEEMVQQEAQQKRPLMDSTTLRANLESIPFAESLDNATKAANGIPTRDGRTELPEAVREMQTSALMTIDPVTADFIEEPEPQNRGPVDELEMLHQHQRRQSQDLAHDRPPSKSSVDRRVRSPPAQLIDTNMTDAQIRDHLKDTTFHRRLRAIIKLEAQETLLHDPNVKEKDPRVTQVTQTFHPLEQQLANLTKQLDDIFKKSNPALFT